MSLELMESVLGDEVLDPNEETFLLFSTSMPSQNLGFMDSKASTLEVLVGDREYEINQSPGLLSSNRSGGTTGAVIWKISPRFAEWISLPNNFLFNNELLSSHSTVLELGCGVSGIVALSLSPLVHKFVASDQEYVLKGFKENILQNQRWPKRASSNHKVLKQDTKRDLGNISAISLDWEQDMFNYELLGSEGSLDAIVACDCIYNEALIKPFIDTCADACVNPTFSSSRSPICIVAQQLRSADIFQAWLQAFHDRFHVWRVPDSLLTPGLVQDSGFVIHVGVLRRQ